MKVIYQAVATLVALYKLILTEASCAPDALDYHETIAMKIEEAGSIPVAVNDTYPFSYNMMVADDFVDTTFFFDQKNGIIYDESGSKVYDVSSDPIPDGLTLDHPTTGASTTMKIAAMARGNNKEEITVVFASSTLPPIISEAHAQLPPAGAYPGYYCGPGDHNFTRDLYRTEELPSCVSIGRGFNPYTIYFVFYNFDLENGMLSNPRPFFAHENQMLPGHFGGAIARYGNSLLYSVGDCKIFGTDGGYSAQLDTSHCGKILNIDTSNVGSYEFAAKGVRNSQQMKIIEKGSANKSFLLFMDIGGVTAEEVNVIKMNKLISGKKIRNFGWGRSQIDGKAREGTCYVGPGFPGIL